MGEAARSFLVEGQRIAAKPLASGLYLVATPIGNLGDITVRALATLAAADLIACEDTRVTRVLLGRYGIEAPLSAYHDHNSDRQRPRILATLAEGKAVALVSDAGTPLISDPGYRLVVDATAAGHMVVPIPGASALLAALTASGLPTDSFFFAGFLPPKQAARRKRLTELAPIPATLVFYESPQRLVASLSDMASSLGETRSAVVARELTKMFEEIRRGDLGGLAHDYQTSGPPKGEIVIVVAPGAGTAPSKEAVDKLLASLLVDNSVGSAVAEAAVATGLPRRDLYRRALALKDSNGGD